MKEAFSRGCQMQDANKTNLDQIIYFHVFLPVDRRGQARDGIAYGPLTDLPDWSFAGKRRLFDYCFYNI